MSKTNCINCGAAKDTAEIRCPFCGTTYLDLTAIDFSSDAPVVCKFVLPDQYRVDGIDGKLIMTTTARPKLEELSDNVETADIYQSWGQAYSFTTRRSMKIGISFEPVSVEDNVLFELGFEECQ